MNKQKIKEDLIRYGGVVGNNRVLYFCKYPSEFLKNKKDKLKEGYFVVVENPYETIDGVFWENDHTSLTSGSKNLYFRLKKPIRSNIAWRINFCGREYVEAMKELLEEFLNANRT